MRPYRYRVWTVLCLLAAVGRSGAAPPSCPVTPAAVQILVDNRSDDTDLALTVEGTLAAADATCTGGGATTYAQTLSCHGAGLVDCGRIDGLRPGAWINRLAVTVTGSAPQVQASAAVFVTGNAGANVLVRPVYPRTFVVDSASEAALRTQLAAAAGYTAGHTGRGALVTFARDAFPGASAPRTIDVGIPPAPADPCKHVALCLDGSEIVVDALDADARAGGVVLSVGARELALLRVVGADNVLRGLVLQGSQANAPATQVDTIAFSGAAAQGNRLEQTLVRGPTRGDASSADTDAVDNVIDRCEISGARDKGLKVTTGAQLQIQRSCVHDNRNGGVQSTLGGHIVARDNVIQHNVPGPSGNGFSATGSYPILTTLATRGNIVRFAGARGISVTDNAAATFSNDYVADNQFSGAKVETTERGPGDVAPRAEFRGVAFVCNRNAGISGSCQGEPAGTDDVPCQTDADCCEGDSEDPVPVCGNPPPTCGPLGAVDGLGAAESQLAGTPAPFADYGTAAEPGRNAFTRNRNRPQGANLKHTVAGPSLSARGNQWEHCGSGASCVLATILSQDVLLGAGAGIDLGAPAGARAGTPVLTTVTPSRPRRGDVVRVFGDNFNAIEGTGCAGATAPVAPCSPENPGTTNANLATNANRIDILTPGGGLIASNVPPDAVTPTMLVFRMPFDCYAPLLLKVSKVDPSNRFVSTSIPLCDPTPCADQPATTPCDDGDPCTLNDHCSGAEPSVCTGTPKDCGAQCLGCVGDGDCVPKSGIASCTDGDACTTGDHCSGVDGDCIRGSGTLPCNGTCLTGVCDPVTGCVPKPATESCVDNNACTVDDHCSGTSNACVAGRTADCSGPCFTGACSTFTGCLPRPATTVCDDSNPCTAGDHCSGVSDGMCVGGTTAPCTGQCFTGFCDPVAGCEPKGAGDGCEDGNRCTLGDHCDGSGACIAGTQAPSCDGECLTGVCDPARGCVSKSPDVVCNDGNLCTVSDHCSNGTCNGSPLPCFGACLSGACDPQRGCIPKPATSPCGDGSRCTIGDHCSGDANVCVPGDIHLDCSGTCLTGECNPVTGCIPAAAVTTCDDGNVCTVGDHCSGTQSANQSLCLSGAQRDCSGPCATGVCDVEKGCLLAPADAPCEDGNACTVGDHCRADGVCLTGDGTRTCDGTCLTGVCDPASGCVPKSSAVQCDDGSTCTTGDHCRGDGDACVGGPVTCDAPCLTGACDPATGCVVQADGTDCTPENHCRTGTCDHAACRATGDLSCVDDDVCTADTCDPAVGCRHDAVTGLGATDCCLSTVRLDCGNKKIGKKLVKQWKKTDKALLAAQTPKPDPKGKRLKRLEKALKVLRTLRRSCPDNPVVPDCLRTGA